MTALKPLLLVLMVVCVSFATSGSGTIQNCSTNGWDYCLINTSSTITGTDFSLTNKGINISAGVVITMNYSRLELNSTEYLNIFGTINGSGVKGSSQAGNGGTGGGYTEVSGVYTRSFNGSTNGSDGYCTYGHCGNGSEVMPFESTPGAHGTASSTGGGFYATPYCYVHGITGSPSAIASAGGSGQAIYLTAPVINITGKVLADAGDSYVSGSSSRGICGGSGGGEIIIRGVNVSVTGNVTADGSDADILDSPPEAADGGAGGVITICGTSFESVTGEVWALGGAGANGGVDGPNGTMNNCYPYPQWNVTFNCTDEMNNNSKNFTATIIQGAGQTLVSTEVLNYSFVPTEYFNDTLIALQHPIGVYLECWNGTSRYYVAAPTGSYNIRGYSLNVTLGAYYAFTVKNTLGSVISGVEISAYRWDPDLDAYVVIEQAITDSGGVGTLYLEPFVPYRLIAVADGYVVLTYTFIPSTTSSITIILTSSGSSGGNETLEIPGYDYLWDDTSFSLSPSGYYATNNTNISFTVVSNGSYIEYYGMNITRITNGTRATVYSNNVTGQPAGGVVQYELNESGVYYIDAWFKHQNYSEYDLLTKTFQYGNYSGFMRARDEFITTNPISGWGFYFLAIVVAMLVGGFVSRYTIEGAGLVSLVVLWVFTLFNPGAELVCIGGIGGCINTLHATILTTVAVISGLYYIWRGG